jgi:xanthine dehydrogenase YagR molybdenum-binding subunit
VNGEPQVHTVDGDERAIDFLRRRCGLTGAKDACGTGQCGACTALVDGVPHVTCLLPAVALDARQVTTPEGLSAGSAALGALHPVQRAFLAHDALQCGYCTPGFAVSAAAFVDRWRAAHGATAPSDEEIASALSGHLCRCGAYPAIRAAVAAACRGEHDVPSGTAPARPEAPDKVTGLAKYTTDLRIEGMLEGRILRSPHAHARLRGLDDRGARGVPGVEAIVRFVEDGGMVRYAGQEIAAVAAIDRKAADRALALLGPDYEILPAVTSMEAARADGAPLVYADETEAKGAPRAAEGPLAQGPLAGNVRGPMSAMALLGGQPKQGHDGVAEAKRTGDAAEGVWETAAQSHTPLEPHAAIVRWTGKTTAEVWAGTQGCQLLAEEMADHYDTNARRIAVHTEHVGGAFGSKIGLQMEVRAAADLARAAQAPVRVVLDRVEELTVGGHRPAQRVSVAVGLSGRGELIGIVHEAHADTGVAVGNVTGPSVRQLYDIPAKDLEDWDVLTHTPPAKPFRAPGGPPALLALEGALDAIGTRRDQSPLTLRKAFDRHEARNDLYRWAETLPALRGRGPPAKDTGRFQRGVGFAAGAWYHLWDPYTQVELDASEERIVLRCGTQDIGNGTRGMLAAAVGEALGVPPSAVTVEIGHSEGVHGPSAVGSRTTASLTPTVEHAVDQLVETLYERAIRSDWEGERTPDGFRKTDGTVVPWKDLLVGSPPIRTVGRRKQDDRTAVVPFAVDEIKLGRVPAGVVTVAAVEVDRRLARVRVTEAWIGIGAGRIVSEVLARSQVEGAFVQNLGYALYERRVLDPATGRLLSHNLDDYRIPGIGDVPPVHVHFETRGFEHVRGGAVGLSELSGVAVPAAIANAVSHATGRRPYRLPLDPSTIRELLA